MQTIIIERETKSKEQVELTLPYYAQADYYGTPKYLAVTGKDDGISINFISDVPILGKARAAELTADHTRISEEEFDAAFRKAMSALEAKRAEVCPNIL